MKSSQWIKKNYTVFSIKYTAIKTFHEKKSDAVCKGTLYIYRATWVAIRTSNETMQMVDYQYASDCQLNVTCK